MPLPVPASQHAGAKSVSGTLPPMIVAEWIATGAAVLLALTSLVAVITWRENRRRDRETRQREHETEMGDRILDSARREFSTKEEVGGLKSNLLGLGVMGLLVAGLVVWDKLSSADKQQD